MANRVKSSTERRVSVGIGNAWQGSTRSRLAGLPPFSFCSCLHVECGSIFWDDRSANSWTPDNKSAKLGFSQS